MSLAKARYDATVVYMVVTDYISSLRTYTRVKLYARPLFQFFSGNVATF